MNTISFMRNLTRRSLLAAVMGLVLSGAAAFAADPGMKTLHGHVPAVVSGLQAKGLLPANTNLTLAIGLPLRNTDALTNLLRQIYDPSSTNYHRYLTPDEFTAQFGPTEQDYQKVVDFANANGLAVTKTHGNRMLLDVSGKVSDVEKAFHVKMRTYHHPTENRDFFAPDAEPSVGSSLPVLHVTGLDNYEVPHSLLHKMPVSNVKPALGSGPGGGYIGSDFRSAYVPGATLTGAGQTVGLLQFDSGFFQSDITAYEIQAGLPNVPVQAVLLDGYNGGSGNANDEVSLDIEMVISMAPGISKVLVFEGSLPDDILNAMAASNQVRQLSASWSYPIDALTEQIYQQFAAQGQSFFNASGDSDAWLTGQIPQPCDDPHITIVGGTTLTTSANNAWASETVWNWGIEFGPADDGIGGGGGISTAYLVPSWQTNINMTDNMGSTTFRNIPDVALTADNVYVNYGGGLNGTFGGTSCASPLWAGFTALVNQQAALNGNRSVGFLNPALYAIAQSAIYTNCFHDITTGNNTWSLSPNLFYATNGYDLCTGLGTPAGANLINALAGNNFITPITAPAPPYGSTLAALNGGNPNGAWSLFVLDDQSPDSGVISNGWSFTLTTGSLVGFAADKALSMTASATDVLVNSNVTYTVGLTNYGPSSSSNMIMLDTLPSGVTVVAITNTLVGSSVEVNASQISWNLGTLATGAGAQLMLTMSSSSVGIITNSAIVQADTTDANIDNNSASVAVNVVSSLPPPQVSAISVGGGAFHLTISNPNASTVIIQASTNLVNWVNVYTSTLPSITFNDSTQTNYHDRFYRAKIGP